MLGSRACARSFLRPCLVLRCLLHGRKGESLSVHHAERCRGKRERKCRRAEPDGGSRGTVRGPTERAPTTKFPVRHARFITQHVLYDDDARANNLELESHAQMQSTRPVLFLAAVVTATALGISAIHARQREERRVRLPLVNRHLAQTRLTWPSRVPCAQRTHGAALPSTVFSRASSVASRLSGSSRGRATRPGASRSEA